MNKEPASFYATKRPRSDDAPRSVAQSGVEARMEAAVRQAPAMAHWLPRIGAAVILLYHGFAHWADIDAFAQTAGTGTFVAFLVGAFETGGGFLLLLGGLRVPAADVATRVGGLLVVLALGAAIATIHWPYWAFDAPQRFPEGGMEFQVLLAALGVHFLLRGHPEALPSPPRTLPL